MIADMIAITAVLGGHTKIKVAYAAAVPVGLQRASPSVFAFGLNTRVKY